MVDFLRLIDVNAGGLGLKMGQGISHLIEIMCSQRYKAYSDRAEEVKTGQTRFSPSDPICVRPHLPSAKNTPGSLEKAAQIQPKLGLKNGNVVLCCGLSQALSIKDSPLLSDCTQALQKSGSGPLVDVKSRNYRPLLTC